MIRLLIIYLVIAVIALFVPTNTHAQQNSPDQIVIDLNNIENDVQRVEIQRYIGYENLLARYLTLPYDISVNTGRQGRYFDIGYMLLLLFPIALLLITYKRKRIFYSCMIAMGVYLMLSFCYSFVNIDKVGAVQRSANNWNELTSKGDNSVMQSFLVTVYNTSYTIVTPMRKLIERVSGESDHITYPILFILLIIGIGLSLLIFRTNKKAQILSIIIVMFFFLWLMLAGGIIWYGFILIPLIYIFSIKGISLSNYRWHKQIQVLLLVPTLLWLVVAYAARVSNIDVYTSQENLGKSIVDPKLIYYTTGIHSADESINQIYNNISGALDKINSDNSFIYQIGTSIAFDIKNNYKRSYHDNVLTAFFAHLKGDKTIDFFKEVLKPSGFRYLIVDLLTPTLDKTPEQSLSKKYQLLLNALYQNKNMNLLATDRILEITDSDRQVWKVNDLFPKDYNPNDKIRVINRGSYAIYEIM